MPWAIRDDHAYERGVTLWLKPEGNRPEHGSRHNYPLTHNGNRRRESYGYWTRVLKRAAQYQTLEDAMEDVASLETVVDLVQLVLTTDYLTKHLTTQPPEQHEQQE